VPVQQQSLVALIENVFADSNARLVHPALVLNEHAGSDKAFNYVAPDFSGICSRLLHRILSTNPLFPEGVTKTELLAIRFGTPENAALFKVCKRMNSMLLDIFLLDMLLDIFLGTFWQGPATQRQAGASCIWRWFGCFQPSFNPFQRRSEG
jgi:hypothetical protein